MLLLGLVVFIVREVLGGGGGVTISVTKAGVDGVEAGDVLDFVDDWEVKEVHLSFGVNSVHFSEVSEV